MQCEDKEPKACRTEFFSKYAMNINLEATFFRNTLGKIPRKKTPANIMPVFTLEEVQILMAMPNDRTEIGKRDKVLLSTMYGAGMRCHETCNLKIRNIHFKNGGGAHVDIINGKAGNPGASGFPNHVPRS